MQTDHPYAELPDYAVAFLDYLLTIRGKSEKTIQEYFYDLRTFFRFIKQNQHLVPDSLPFDEIQVNDLTLDQLKKVDLADLYGYMSFRSRNRHNTSVTRARKVASIRSFYKYLFTKVKLIDVNPAAELDSPKVLHRLPKYLNLEESIDLLNNVTGEHQKRDYAIITLFMNCGLRLQELVNINISNMRDGRLTVIGKGNKERTVYLNNACQNAILAYLPVRNEMRGIKDKNALFISERKTRISPKTVQVLVKNHLRAAGLDTEKYSVHKLRHTAATLMYKHGHVDIRALQQILGHESIATTEIYTHVDELQLRKAVADNPLADVVAKKSEDT